MRRELLPLFAMEKIRDRSGGTEFQIEEGLYFDEKSRKRDEEILERERTQLLSYKMIAES